MFTRNRINFIIFSFLITIFFVHSNIYAESLIKQIVAQRDANGAILIIGQANLPKGTKIMIDLIRGNKLLGQSTVYLAEEGKFKSDAFTDRGKPYPEGSYKISLMSYFTKIWQSADVLAKVGENGILLPQLLLTPDDPEFPNATKHLEVNLDIVFPKVLTPKISSKQEVVNLDNEIIKAVQEAYLEIPGKGRSADPIIKVVALFEKAGGFKALKWSAKLGAKEKWVITLDCIDAGKQKQAQWEYDPKLKSVKYLDPLAKILSWLPAE